MTVTSVKNSLCERERHRPARELSSTLKELDAADIQAVDGPAVESCQKGPHEIELLYAALAGVTEANHPRTARLLASSSRKVAQKLIEEASEVALAAVKHHPRKIVLESVDLLYQLAVLWHREAVSPQEIWEEMRRRADMLGIAEKLPKSPKPV
jgi:phosphoribosyl-ATP pyrophosphohydrolase